MLRGDPTGHDRLVGGKRNTSQSPPEGGGQGGVQTEKVILTKWLQLLMENYSLTRKKREGNLLFS
jgi:hypothetical protein